VSTSLNMPVPARHIDALRKLGAVILPGTSTQPSFTDVDPNNDHLRKALQHLTFDAPVALAAVAGGVEDPEDFLNRLRTEDPATFHSVWMVCVGAYYVNRAVWERIDYPGRIPYPVAPAEAASQLNFSQLQAVIDRGPIFRPAPN
jgi:hypothetical protein